jgi:chaperone required for assembly of F1-ATPase
MRDIFKEIFINQPLAPMDSARQGAQPTLRKPSMNARTPEKHQVIALFPVLLDGKPVRTPARRLLAAPTYALAERIAQECPLAINAHFMEITART